MKKTHPEYTSTPEKWDLYRKSNRHTEIEGGRDLFVSQLKRCVNCTVHFNTTKQEDTFCSKRCRREHYE